MKHKAGFNRLSKKASHRKAMTRNMVTSLFKHERITTTKAKAKAIQVTAEKMITRAKIDSVHNRRLIARNIADKTILAKLFTEIGPRFKERNGGYTSIIKIGHRQGDAAEMVILEFVKDDEESGSRKKTKKKAAPKTEVKKEEKPVIEEKAEAVAVEAPAEKDAEVEETAAEENTASVKTDEKSDEAEKNTEE